MNHFYILLNFKLKSVSFSLNFIKKKKRHYSHTALVKTKIFFVHTFEGIRFQMLHIKAHYSL